MGLAEHFAKIPRDQRKRTIYFVAPGAHHEGDLAVKEWRNTAAGRAMLAKTAAILQCEHSSATQVYWMSSDMRKANMASSHRFFVNRSKRLEQILVDASRLFGVSLNAIPQGRPGGAIAPLWNDAPALEIIESNAFYHSDFDTADIVPAAGLEAMTRMYAKIIDDLNRVPLAQLVDAPRAVVTPPR